MQCLYFPVLHKELARSSLPAGVFLLDPGLAPAESGPYWRPPDLPMGGEESERFIRECLDFGDRFRDPSDLASLAAQGPEDFFSGTSMSIRHQLRRRMEHEGQESAFATRLQGQMMLLLAWFAEEKGLEMQELDRGLQAQWQSLQEAMGMDGGTRPPGQGHFLSASGPELISWRKLLPWFLLFLPRNAALYVQDEEIVQEWIEFGVGFAPPEGGRTGSDCGTCAGQGVLIASAPGWRLALHRSSAPQRPWLSREYRVKAACRSCSG